MKKLLIILSVLLLSGCSPNPTPTEAVKQCLDKGWIPVYIAKPAVTTFICSPTGKEIEEF